MYNGFKIERISASEKKERPYLVKTNVHNLKNTVRGILLFCNKIPDKKPEDLTEILAWKNSLELMANEAINKLLLESTEKGLINNEKELTVTFVRGNIVGKNTFGDTILLLDYYGKEEFTNTLILMTK